MLIRTDETPTGLGYLEIRHQPGVPLPEGVTTTNFEADTYTCRHCCSVVICNPARVRPRYKCRGCDHHLCDNCAALRTAGGPCRTFQQLADEVMQASVFAEARGGIVLTDGHMQLALSSNEPEAVPIALPTK